MLRRLELGLSDLASIVDRAHARGLHAIVTVFNVDLVEEARGLAWDAFKTASPDIVHQPLLEAIANDDRPMIVSTGASTMGEVSRAAQWLAAARDRLAMLQCVSCYPAPEAALGGIAAIRQTTGLPTGYSDHTESVETGALAVHAGACILERHITDDRSRVGPDHAASLDGEQFAKYVALCSSALQADASGNMTHQAEHRLEAAPTATKMVLPCERDVRQVSRQSIVARRRIEQGEVIEPEDLTFKRPGNGLEPWQMPVVVGKTARHVIAEDSLIEFKDLVGLARAS
jgi:sialic acid synthase SpsE